MLCIYTRYVKASGFVRRNVIPCLVTQFVVSPPRKIYKQGWHWEVGINGPDNTGPQNTQNMHAVSAR